MTKKDLNSFYTEVRFCVADLQPDFDVISIYTDCRIGHLSALPTFRKIVCFLIANGVREVVRIMPEGCVFTKQALNITARMQGYRPLYASNLKEAEEKLDSLAIRNGLRLHFHKLLAEYTYDGATQTANILNISTSGCAIASTDTSFLSTGKEVAIKIIFDAPDAMEELFEVFATIVRVEDDSFAVHFNEVDNEQSELLFKHLIRECQRDF